MLKFSCWKNSIKLHTSWTTHYRTAADDDFTAPIIYTLMSFTHSPATTTTNTNSFHDFIEKITPPSPRRGLPLTFCLIDGVPCIVFQIVVADNSRFVGKWKKVSTAFIERMTEWDFVMAQTFALLLPTEITARGKSAKISFVANVVCNFIWRSQFFVAMVTEENLWCNDLFSKGSTNLALTL